MDHECQERVFKNATLREVLQIAKHTLDELTTILDYKHTIEKIGTIQQQIKKLETK